MGAYDKAIETHFDVNNYNVDVHGIMIQEGKLMNLDMEGEGIHKGINSRDII